MLEKIKTLCKENGISLEDLAKMTDQGEKAIYTWDHRMPSADRLARVARVLGTTVEDLLEDEDGKQAINS